MKMNKTLAYGLACLYYLGETNNGQWTRRKKIQELGFSGDYCTRILQALICAGLVESRKGRGYRLKKDSGDICAWDLMESFIFNSAGAADNLVNQLAVNLYKTLNTEANHRLAGLTVQDIIRMTVNKKCRKERRVKLKTRRTHILRDDK